MAWIQCRIPYKSYNIPSMSWWRDFGLVIKLSFLCLTIWFSSNWFSFKWFYLVFLDQDKLLTYFLNVPQKSNSMTTLSTLYHIHYFIETSKFIFSKYTYEVLMCWPSSVHIVCRYSYIEIGLLLPKRLSILVNVNFSFPLSLKT